MEFAFSKFLTDFWRNIVSAPQNATNCVLPFTYVFTYEKCSNASFTFTASQACSDHFISLLLCFISLVGLTLVGSAPFIPVFTTSSLLFTLPSLSFTLFLLRVSPVAFTPGFGYLKGGRR